MVTDRISIRSVTFPFSSTGASEIACTTSRPSTTRPNTVTVPLSATWSVTAMKNWLPALSGLPGCSTAATAPRVTGSRLNSCASIPSPPVPYIARLAGSFDSGSPPWMSPMRKAL